MLEPQDFERRAVEAERLIFLTIILMLVAWLFAVQARGADPDPALWIARSCAGEAGLDSASTGECAAIAHIYRKRAEMYGRDTLEIARKYSAAIKPRSGHSRRWVLSLVRTGEKPKNWPQGASWARYRESWLELLDYCDRFVAGEIPDPLPEAVHYGGAVDSHRAVGWYEIKTTFRNRYYSVRKPKEYPKCQTKQKKNCWQKSPR